MRAAHFNPHPTIYFARSGHQGLIKIGHSTTVIARLRNLQLDNAASVVVLGMRDGTRADECELHERFKAYRLHGEWFLPRKQILAYIKNETEKPDDYLRRILGRKSYLLIDNNPKLFGLKPMKKAAPEGYITIRQLATRMQRSTYSIRDAITEGRLPAIKIHRRRLIADEHAKSFVQHVRKGQPMSTFAVAATNEADGWKILPFLSVVDPDGEKMGNKTLSAL